jgi:hypothetical protein
MRLVLVLPLLVFAVGCGSSSSSPLKPLVTASGPLAAGAVRLKAEVWADNWFAFYLGEKKIAEDSVPITTERSFNAETFTFDAVYPLELNFVVKDFIENDSGLEYIGKRNQQRGDGGFILQLTDTATGRVVAVSDSRVRCLAVHRAPLNAECEKAGDPLAACQSRILEEPAGWKSAGFDVSGWEAAKVYSAREVGPKGGYDGIRWDAAAKLIWTSDLKADNTLLCKLRVEEGSR